jgi:hypothetical protein
MRPHGARAIMRKRVLSTYSVLTGNKRAHWLSDGHDTDQITLRDPSLSFEPVEIWGPC